MEERRGNKQKKPSGTTASSTQGCVFFFPTTDKDDLLISFSLSEQCHTDPTASPGHSPGAHCGHRAPVDLLGEIRTSRGGDRGWPGVLPPQTEHAQV